MKQFNSKREYFDDITKEGVREKPVVEYESIGTPIIVGGSARVIPFNHPAEYLNGDVVITSSVVSVDEVTGNFETRNTKYVCVR